jgi:hypothetical protein
MADLFQGAQLPDVTTTQTATTTAPDWYNNFLSGLASSGQSAVQAGGVAPLSDLQKQAMAMAPTAIQAGQPALSTAQQFATNVGTTPSASMVGNYMNPFTASVLDEINRRGQQQWRQTIAPSVTGGAVGSGQFGSQRGIQALAQAGRDVNANILGTQATTAATAFDNAIKAAQSQQQANLLASQTLGQIGQQQYAQGAGGLGVLSGLGAQEQAQKQAEMNYPMTAQANFANLMRGFNIPTSQTQTYKGPVPGAYGLSPLQQILGLATGAGSVLMPKYRADGTMIPDSSLLTGSLKGIQDLMGLLKGQSNLSLPSSGGSIDPTTGAPYDVGGSYTGTIGDTGVDYSLLDIFQ